MAPNWVWQADAATNEPQSIDIALARIDDRSPRQQGWGVRMRKGQFEISGRKLEPLGFVVSDLNPEAAFMSWPNCMPQDLNCGGQFE